LRDVGRLFLITTERDWEEPTPVLVRELWATETSFLVEAFRDFIVVKVRFESVEPGVVPANR
jgi:hypothetical protein